MENDTTANNNSPISKIYRITAFVSYSQLQLQLGIGCLNKCFHQSRHPYQLVLCGIQCVSITNEPITVKSNTRMLILIIVTVMTLVLETTIARLYAYFAPGPQSLQLNLVFFTSAIIIFSSTHILILFNIKKQIKALLVLGRQRLNFTFNYVLVSQFVLNALLVGVCTNSG